MTPELMDFRGIWQMSRRIDDRKAGETAHAEGQAELSPREGGLLYLERTELLLPGRPPFQAERRYLWQAAPEGGIEVLFDDGRPFHVFDPASGRPSARHDCEPDLYLVSYSFAGWPEWQVTWRVTGPRKDYLMHSTYTPAETGGTSP